MLQLHRKIILHFLQSAEAEELCDLLHGANTQVNQHDERRKQDDAVCSHFTHSINEQSMNTVSMSTSQLHVALFNSRNPFAHHCQNDAQPHHQQCQLHEQLEYLEFERANQLQREEYQEDRNEKGCQAKLFVDEEERHHQSKLTTCILDFDAFVQHISILQTFAETKVLSTRIDVGTKRENHEDRNKHQHHSDDNACYLPTRNHLLVLPLSVTRRSLSSFCFTCRLRFCICFRIRLCHVVFERLF